MIMQVVSHTGGKTQSVAQIKADPFFNQLCGVVEIKTDDQRARLATLLGPLGSCHDQWIALKRTNASGPLSLCSSDELSLFASLKHRDAFDAVAEGITAHSPHPKQVAAAREQIMKYNEAFNKISASFRAHVAREISLLKDIPKPRTPVSLAQQKLESLSLRKSKMETEVANLELKANNRLAHYESVVKSESRIAKDQPAFYADHYNLGDEGQLSNLTLSSYDHVIQKLSDLGLELDLDTAEQEATVSDARHKASQIVLSLATKCQMALDIVFSEASSTYAKNAPNVPAQARAIYHERDDIKIEIQSLWDELVPVAHMAVETEFLQPVLRRLEKQQYDRDVRNALIASYTSAVLRILNLRLRRVVDRIMTLVLHHQALYSTYQYIEARAKHLPIDDLAVSAANKIPLTGTESAKTDLHEVVQYHLDVYSSVPIDVINGISPTREGLTQLDRLARRRILKKDESARNLHLFFEAAAKSGLTDQEISSQLLLEAILADSASGLQVPGGALEDAQLKASISDMRDQVASIVHAWHHSGLQRPASAPDYVVEAYRRTAEALAIKSGEGCFVPGKQEKAVTCAKCTKYLSFEGFVRKWGE
ncbi:hypothetical protein F4778DRAFT_756713 [Xylariomycetidae sp. FL2044]|nr:hypothetical protein F4778DRAFT_756713 [Xylariomycetidae sp. FL2044]